MIKKISFPANAGIDFTAQVKETDTGVSIPGFTFILDGVSYPMGEAAFDLSEIGDEVRITPSGMVKHSLKDMDCTSKFPNGSNFWLVHKNEDNIAVLEVEKQ